LRAEIGWNGKDAMISLVEHPPESLLAKWRRNSRQSFAHFWPRVAGAYVHDLWTRLPGHPATARRAALTFDDGPTDAGTPKLLDILAAHNVRATFFLIGENVRRHPQRVREIVQAGHTLGNHFRRHIDCWKTPPREVIREVTEGGRILEDVVGVSPAWCRPPFGRLTHAIVKWSRVHRQQIVLWDVFPPDYREDSTVAGLKHVLESRLRARSIVCLHDNAASIGKTPVMLDQTLPGFIQKGWRFVSLEQPPR
jgi:peptidoglycan-N-acetylglucosamine deacetylase